MSELETVGRLLVHPGFLLGAAIGSATLGLMYLVRSRGVNVRGWSLAVSSATLLIIAIRHDVDSSILLSLAGVAGAGAVVDLTRWSPSGLRVGTAGLFGLVTTSVAVVAFTLVFDPTSLLLIVALPVVILVVGPSMARFQTDASAGLHGALIAVTVLGIWVTVPETGMVVVMVGVSLTLAWATFPPVNARSSFSGSLVLVALLAWLTTTGAGESGRWVLGGLACLAIFPVLSVVRSLGIMSIEPRRLLFFHIVYVALATRVVDHIESEVVAAGAIFVLVLGLLSGLYLSPGVVDSSSRQGVEQKS